MQAPSALFLKLGQFLNYLGYILAIATVPSKRNELLFIAVA